MFLAPCPKHTKPSETISVVIFKLVPHGTLCFPNVLSWGEWGAVIPVPRVSVRAILWHVCQSLHPVPSPPQELRWLPQQVTGGKGRSAPQQLGTGFRQ